MAITERTLRLERGLRNQLEQITDAHTRALVSAWVDAWSETEADLTAGLVEQLLAGEHVTRAQLLRSTRLRQALILIKANLEELAKQAGVLIVADLQAVIDTAGGAQASVIDSQLPPDAHQLVNLDAWSRVDARQVTAIVARSTEQITSSLKPLTPQTYDAVRRELIRGVTAGSSPRETARRMVTRAGQRFNGELGLTRALTISRTEILSAHREGAYLGRMQQADVLRGWSWHCELSPRSCPACIAMDGTVFPLDAPGPSDHVNGRCTAVPETKSWADLGFDIPEPPSIRQSGREWFDGLPEADQAAVMGRERLALLRSGHVGWDDLATLHHNPEWRDSWQVTPVKDLRRKAAA